VYFPGPAIASRSQPRSNPQPVGLMSLFPYNDLPDPDSFAPGASAANYHELLRLAEAVRWWHARNDTSDWSESNDFAQLDIQNLALGLATILSDPGHVETLITLGESRVGHIHDILLSFHDPSTSERYSNSEEHRERVERRYKALVESRMIRGDEDEGHLEWVRLQHAPEEEKRAARKRCLVQYALRMFEDGDEEGRMLLERFNMTEDEARAFVASGPVVDVPISPVL
jgi:hypothetical protein